MIISPLKCDKVIFWLPFYINNIFNEVNFKLHIFSYKIFYDEIIRCFRNHLKHQSFLAFPIPQFLPVVRCFHSFFSRLTQYNKKLKYRKNNFSRRKQKDELLLFCFCYTLIYSCIAIHKVCKVTYVTAAENILHEGKHIIRIITIEYFFICFAHYYKETHGTSIQRKTWWKLRTLLVHF